MGSVFGSVFRLYRGQPRRRGLCVRKCQHPEMCGFFGGVDVHIGRVSSETERESSAE